ncbi:MAG: DUF2670 domain-containing protein [Rickettsiaceae bacterium]
MFGSFLGKFRVLAKSPMTIFVYGILSKWFITIFVAALVVAYWVFKGLSDAGILQAAEDVVFDALTQTKFSSSILHSKNRSFWKFLGLLARSTNLYSK